MRWKAVENGLWSVYQALAGPGRPRQEGAGRQQQSRAAGAVRFYAKRSFLFVRVASQYASNPTDLVRQ